MNMVNLAKDDTSRQRRVHKIGDYPKNKIPEKDMLLAGLASWECSLCSRMEFCSQRAWHVVCGVLMQSWNS